MVKVVDGLIAGFNTLVPIIVGVADAIRAVFDSPIVQGFIGLLGTVARKS